ncbi:NHL repeat-containing protein [Chitinophaga arvensicola]|uniref:Uncharacterized protein n=1 Tax=Chitinophaga arvensicola TaxID=29529 RepID=A0A1I0RVZ5_9BACT|nr:hypothetical protein [Chitinophaga arvensicola]SEW45634.1 hypothetical protein SAMN04488122_3491 [Chitinophaga arvensicola]
MNIKAGGNIFLWLLCSLSVFFFSCTKFKERLDDMNKESGIIRVVKNANTIEEAQIDETITIYAKIGQPEAAIKLYVSGVEATVISRGQTMGLLPGRNDNLRVPMDTFNIVVPKAAKIGPGSIYFSVNDAVQPALSFNIKRPDILIPNKVLVVPQLFTYSDSTQREDGSFDYTVPEVLRDGPAGSAVVNMTAKLTYDKTLGCFYFLDYQRSDRSYRIRRLKDGVVSTIAGGGANYFATTGAALKLGAEATNSIGVAGLDMKPGPDGKLYFTNSFTIASDPVTGLQSAYSLIQCIDPSTGKVEILAGNNGRSVDYYYSNYQKSFRGFEDGGKDSALIGTPRALTFDKQGNLYFIDGGTYFGTLLRKLAKDGSVETVLGKINREYAEFVDADDKTYSVITYSEIEEHSDGFGDEVRLYGAISMVQAGNGKFYVVGAGAGWQTNIVEINMDTKEASTVVGLPDGQRTDYTTGTFKEVGLSIVSTFDVDFDGNILYGLNAIYKMDLQSETISQMTRFTGFPPEYTSDRQFMQHTQPGTNCILGHLSSVVFDQFGNLYAGYDNVSAGVDVRMVKVVIER